MYYNNMIKQSNQKALWFFEETFNNFRAFEDDAFGPLNKGSFATKEVNKT